MGFTHLHCPNTITITITFFLLLAFLPPTFSTRTTITNTPSVGTHPGRFSKIYAFGDSYTDTGNTLSFGYILRPPYGTTFFHRSTNRYSDGRLTVDFLANNLSLPFLSPYLNRSADFSSGVNFAVAGSTAIGYEFFVKNNISHDITPQSLGTQLHWFNQYLEGKKIAMEDALFWVGEIGANDYAYTVGSSVSRDTIRDLALNNVASFLQVLLAKGAKYIVVQGQPLIGCLPISMTLAPAEDRDKLGCSASINKHTFSYNTLLQAKLRKFRREYPNATISYADYFSAHRAVMKNPIMYGFTEPFKACCGSGGGPYNFDALATCGSPKVSQACAEPSKFVNWDGVHLTEAMYKVLADLFFRRGYCWPSFDLLLTSKVHGG